jgi:hypothetical protein
MLNLEGDEEEYHARAGVGERFDPSKQKVDMCGRADVKGH